MRNRLHALCPYFAMFPESFVAKYVDGFTKKNDFIFDPFCGRGTTVLQSLLMDRNAAGSDINPVAYCISSAKARIPTQAAVIARLKVLQSEFEGYSSSSDLLPEFFRCAYHPETLSQILFLRSSLHWLNSDVDRFLAAIVLGSLHGEMNKSSSYFSNQMPRTISTKPVYSISYWRAHGLCAPRRDVFKLLAERIAYRFDTQLPKRKGAVALTDARDAGDVFTALHGKGQAVITSPPYLNITRYEEDQWLRLWFLGHEPKPTYNTVSSDDRHSSEDQYWDFLAEVWEGLAPLLRKKAVLVCRIAAKGITRRDLTDNLYESVLLTFPRAYMVSSPHVSKIRNRQTNNFRPNAKGCFYEMDFAFRLN